MSRHQPENGADSPDALIGYVNPDGSGEGNWSAPVCSMCHGSGVMMGSDEYQTCPKCRGEEAA